MNHSAHWLDDERNRINKHIRTVEDSGDLKSAVPVDTWIHVYQITVCHIHCTASLRQQHSFPKHLVECILKIFTSDGFHAANEQLPTIFANGQLDLTQNFLLAYGSLDMKK